MGLNGARPRRRLGVKRLSQPSNDISTQLLDAMTIEPGRVADIVSRGGHPSTASGRSSPEQRRAGNQAIAADRIDHCDRGGSTTVFLARINPHLVFSLTDDGRWLTPAQHPDGSCNWSSVSVGTAIYPTLRGGLTTWDDFPMQ